MNPEDRQALIYKAEYEWRQLEAHFSTLLLYSRLPSKSNMKIDKLSTKLDVSRLQQLIDRLFC